MLLLLCLLACAPKQVDARLLTLEVQVAALQERAAVLEGDTGAQERRDQDGAVVYEAAMDALEAMDMDRARQLFDQLDSEYAGTRAQQQAQRYRTELDLVGQSAVGLDAEYWLQGYASITEGTWVVVFFEQWCPHCRRELPSMNEQVDAYRAAGIEVVAATQLTKASTEDNTREFLTERGITLPVAKVGTAAWGEYRVRGIPAAVVVSDGTILWRGHPARLSPEGVAALRPE